MVSLVDLVGLGCLVVRGGLLDLAYRVDLVDLHDQRDTGDKFDLGGLVGIVDIADPLV